ncbi:MAG: cupin domain-containing protein, partial [Polyangiales bacterium]
MAGPMVYAKLLAGQLDEAQVQWQPFRPGVEIARLYGGAPNASSAALLRYAPNAQVPRHIHRGYEHILILRGSQRDDHGTYAAGSLLISEPGSSHAIASDEGCLVLAIWERPV